MKLTDRQLKIAQAVAKGMNNPEIAEAFGISESTVSSHLHAAMRILGVEQRRQVGPALERWETGCTEALCGGGAIVAAAPSEAVRKLLTEQYGFNADEVPQFYRDLLGAAAVATIITK